MPLLGHRPHRSCAAAQSILSHKPAFINPSFLSCSLLAGSTPMAELQQNHACSYHRHTLHLLHGSKTVRLPKTNSNKTQPAQPSPRQDKTPGGGCFHSFPLVEMLLPRGVGPLQTLPWGWGSPWTPDAGRDLLSAVGLKQLEAVSLNISLLLGKY